MIICGIDPGLSGGLSFFNNETKIIHAEKAPIYQLKTKTKTKRFAMLIYNKDLSVSPITTHLPLKHVSKTISKNLILEKVKLINSFFKDYMKKKPNIAVTGLNPHCESVDIFNEDQKILKYYDPFFQVSRANYIWDFALPSLNNNLQPEHHPTQGIITRS